MAASTQKRRSPARPRIYPLKEATLIVGIDVHKHTHAAALIDDPAAADRRADRCPTARRAIGA